MIDEQGRPSAPLDPPARGAGGVRTVLVVDDVWISRRTAARFLSEAGVRVFEADSAAEAWEVLERVNGEIDLVLTDVVMPGMNGIRFGREIAQRWPTVRVLYMSAYSARVLEDYGFDLATTPLIQKPFSAETLLYKVDEALKSGLTR